MDILQPSQPNLLINGLMELFQRGTAQIVGAANATYFADRWKTNQTITGTGPTLDQSVDVPSKALGDPFNALSQFSQLYTGPAADVFTAGEFASVQQSIEGYNFAPHRFGTFAMTFKVKSSLPGIYTIGFRNSNNLASYITEYTINSANTWEEKTVFMKEPPPLTLGVWNFTTGVGLNVQFGLDSGSTFRTSQTDQWVSGIFHSSANAVNFFANGGETIRFCDVMFTPGPFGIPVTRAGRDFPEELAKAQRYYEKSYEFNVAPGTVTSNNTHHWHFLAVNRELTTVNYINEKRSIPSSVHMYNPVTGVIDNVRQGDASANVAAGSISPNGTKNFSTFAGGVFALGQFWFAHWTSDAEL